MWRLLLILSSYIAYVTCAVALEYQDILPGELPGCKDSKGTLRNLGETWQYENDCLENRCLSVNDTKSVILYTSCGVIAVGDPCKIIQDRNLTFPDCCPEPECPKNRSPNM